MTIGNDARAVRDRLVEAARTIERLRDELRTERTKRRAPIAVVGLATRLPGGGETPEAFWRVLRDGVDTTREFPRDRGDAAALYHPDPDHPGTAYVVRGGFLTERIDGFDPAVFGISPREAVGMDPQQRISLELAWEALERAGYAPDRLADTATGVWMGLSTTDYVRMRQQYGDIRDVDAYQLVGEPSFTAGRISYTLGLQGPSSVLDTTCSSSLVAIHQACQSLREGECDLALAGGVNLMLSPYGFVMMSKFRALAPDGRCKTFDESADGYARGEGAVVMVLKRLDDALAAGDRVVAVIAGTAVNHDGRSSGLTVPNPDAQKRVIRAALAQAGLEPASVDYVEAHGTGTSLGDPIELHALDAVYREGRPDDEPLVVGSVKTNIGHLESAAGVAGLTKVLLAIDNGTIPPHLHLSVANPKVDWDRLRVVVPTDARPWPRDGRPRAGAVSSFGASGTNAHAVVTEAPPARPRELPEQRPEALLLSARTPTALRTLAARYAEHLAAEPAPGTGPVPLADMAWTTQVGRARMEHGLVVTAADRGKAAAALRAFAEDRQDPAAAPVTRVPHRQRRSAWLFTGQGAQYAGMAAELRRLPAFAEALDSCLELFDPLLPASLREVVWGGGRDARVNDTGFTQPALFAVEYATARTLLACGVTPSALVGHSIGEIAAACVAGVFDLDGAVRLVAARASLMSALPRDGAMVAVTTDEAAAAAAIADLTDTVSIAAVNAPNSVVLSGATADVETAVARLAERGVQAQRLTVSHPFHSPLMQPMVEEFRRVLAEIPMSRPRLPLVSNVTGGWYDDDCLTPEYWIRHALGAVRYADGVRLLHGDGIRTFVEVGPHPVLTALGRRCVDDDEAAPSVWLAPMRRGADALAGMTATLGALDLRGAGVDWRAVHAGRDLRRALLPTYPWERERYWFRMTDGSVADGTPVEGLGRRLRAADPTFEEEHAEVPAGAELGWLVGKAARAAAAATGRRPAAFGAAELLAPPAAGIAAPWLVQWSVRRDDGRLVVAAHGATAAQHRAGAQWHSHGRVEIAAAAPGLPDAPADAVRVPRVDTGGTDGTAGGEVAATEAARDPWAELLADSRIAVAEATGRPATACHPVAFAGLACTDPEAVAGFAVRPGRERDDDGTGGDELADVWLLDADGGTLGLLRGLRWRTDPMLGRAPWYADESVLFDLAWRDVTAALPATAEGHLLLVGGPEPLRAALAGELRGRGTAATEVAALDGVAAALDGAGPDAPVTHVVLLDAAGLPDDAGTDTEVLAERLLPLELGAVALVRSLAARRPAPRLVLVTRGTMRTDDHDGMTSPAGNTLWGLGRVVALEHGEVWGGSVDLPADGDDDPATVADALLSLAAEDGQAVRGRRRFAPRLVHADAAALPAPGGAGELSGTVLVTGGLGGIGIALSRWLGSRGVERVVLTSRGALPPEEAWASLPADHPAAERVRHLRDLREAGIDAVVRPVDVTDTAAMRALVAELAADPDRPLRGVVHAAGVSDPQFIDDVDDDAYTRVWRPKVVGAWALHEATLGVDLDLFVCFSSIASTWGSQHLASYAAGNAFLEGLAHLRRARGLPALTVNWGPWELPSNLFGADVMAFLTSVGLRPLAADQCLSLLGRIARTDAVQRIVCAADWNTYKPVMEARTPRPILAEIEVADEAADSDDDAAREAVLAAGEAGGRPARVAAVVDLLRTAVGAVLHVSRDAVVPDADVFGMGLDSLMVMELSTRCRRALRVPLRPADLFERSTVVEWAEHIDGLLDGGAGGGDGEEAGAPRAEVYESVATLAPLSVLAEDIVPREVPARDLRGAQRRVLLTGVTGFVGAYLLRELLTPDPATGGEVPEVVCLIRCDGEEHGRARLRANLERYLPGADLDLDRVRVLPGDLARPRLGLTDDTWARLAGGDGDGDGDGVIDAVYHNGAWVNFAHTFEQVRAANVDGTEALLRLGVEAGAPVHFVSTYGIWGMPVDGRDQIAEGDDIMAAGRLVTGYVQSKWAAENLVRQAAERGVPVAIYRLGRVLGDAQTGAALLSHFTCRVIKGCIQLGMAPDLDIDVEMTPVDYVTRALVHIARSGPPEDPRKAVYHLINPYHMHFRALMAYVNARGWNVEIVDRDKWWETLQQTLDGTPNELHPVMNTVRELVVGGERAIGYEVTNTEAALAGSGISCPPLDERLLDTYFAYFLASGYLTSP